MATQSFEYGNPGTYTLAIPSNARDVTYIIRGGQGGNTGASSFISSSGLGCGGFTAGARGQRITGKFVDTEVAGKTLTIYIANNANQNNTAFGFDGGSAGGSGYYSGGSGGFAPGGETWCTSGGGAGGGGASTVVIGGTPILVAGGGGGAGGAGFGGVFETQNDPQYNTSLTTNNSGGGNGLNGGNGTSSGNSGSGGGGGGIPRGSGGAENISGNHIPGYPGGGGGGYFNNVAVETAAVTPLANLPAAPANNNEDGYFYIQYDSGDPPTVQFESNPAVLINGQSATLSWQVTSAPGDEPTSIKLNGVNVPATGTQVVSPTVSTDYTLVAVGPGGTTQDTIRLVVIDGSGTGAGATLVFTYGVGNHVVNIPANTTNVFLTLAGGRGGSGGSDAGGGGCSGAGGRVAVLEVLPSENARSFNLYVGSQGNNGASGSPGGKAGGTGGVSGAGNGGTGGTDSLGGGWSGSGGGGGGATGFYDTAANKWVANVGGGGGGGGGSWNVSCSNGASAGGSLGATLNVSSANGNAGANCGGDGGGGGGGGGGHSAGNGGAAGADNSVGGSSGSGGGSAYNSQYFTLSSGTGTNNNNGYATLSFVVPPTISYFRANDDSPSTKIDEGDPVVLSWSTLFNGNETATAAEIDNGIGPVPVGAKFITIASPAATTTYTLTVSSGGTFAQRQVTVEVLPPDDVADSFSFSSVEDAELATTYTSNEVVLSGLDIPVDAYATNGAELSVNGGAYTTATQSVNSGDTMRVRMSSSNLYNTKKTSTVAVGVTNTTYNITTKQQPANVPNNFDFEDVEDAPLQSYIVSSTVTISGLSVTGVVSIPTNGAESSVNGGPFSTAQKLVNNGDDLRLRILTNEVLGNTQTTEITVGGSPVVDWNVVNVLVADANPSYFDFLDKINQVPNSFIESDIITIEGINVPTPVTITNGAQFRINGGAWVTSGNINVNQTLQLRILSSPDFGGVVSTSVTVGNLTDLWQVFTTTFGDTIPDAFYFADRDNQPPNTYVLSNTVLISGITATAPVSVTGGQCSINGNGWVSSGTINNGDTLRLRILSSSSLNTAVSASISIG